MNLSVFSDLLHLEFSGPSEGIMNSTLAKHSGYEWMRAVGSHMCVLSEGFSKGSKFSLLPKLSALAILS